MNFSSLLRPINASRGLISVEIATLAYALLTVLLIFLFFGRLSAPVHLLLERGFVCLVMALLYGSFRFSPCRATLFLRYLFPVTLLSFWYPDTYEFCQLFPNLDHVFAEADQWLFGFQPALHFARALPGMFWSEIFNMGYFSYYLMIAMAFFAPLWYKPRLFSRSVFILMSAFYLYYIIYLFLPVAGPQFYFPAVGYRLIESGHFPQLFDYFTYHPQLLPNGEMEGFFRSLVESAQASGERPTAAFPSSHVGMSTVILFLLWEVRRSLVYLLLPFWVALCGATVYIEAHYFVDVIGGLVTAVAFYYACLWIWRNTRIARTDSEMG